eukprot:NODE_575_length_1468_cov_227.922859.p1 GENE.NODE_575_length_1468_cov_227.922859~~NODE_575_length_1468_cov_227.922859.p1  ORF type:complete len:450 (+),score=122.67 NODE_575_length_1468_cov_227.922859:3-1352(+)
MGDEEKSGTAVEEGLGAAKEWLDDDVVHPVENLAGDIFSAKEEEDKTKKEPKEAKGTEERLKAKGHEEEQHLKDKTNKKKACSSWPQSEGASCLEDSFGGACPKNAFCDSRSAMCRCESGYCAVGRKCATEELDVQVVCSSTLSDQNEGERCAIDSMGYGDMEETCPSNAFCDSEALMCRCRKHYCAEGGRCEKYETVRRNAQRLARLKLLKKQLGAHPNIVTKGELPYDVGMAMLSMLLISAVFGFGTTIVGRCNGWGGGGETDHCKFFWVEFIDCIMDVLSLVFCWASSELEFTNDPSNIVLIALLASTALSCTLFFVELITLRCCKHVFLKVVLELKCLHLMAEDMFQLLLYVFIAVGHMHVSGRLGMVAVSVAVVQASVLLVVKLVEVTSGAKRCCGAVAGNHDVDDDGADDEVSSEEVGCCRAEGSDSSESDFEERSHQVLLRC